MNSRKILILFTGKKISQTDKIFKIKDGFECWNLKKFTLDDLIIVLKKKIPPINKNVLRNYKLNTRRNDMFGITEKEYEECSWALLLPDGLNGSNLGNYSEIIFLLNLYSSKFLYPLFYGSHFGIMQVAHEKSIFEFAHYQNQANIFKKKEFTSFFEKMLPQTQYADWQRDRIEKWSDEDWRLFVAGWLYQGLKEYDNSKNIFGWQRESADMAAILESLFTAGDTKNEEIIYRLCKRIAVLLSWKFPDIEKEIKDLYSQRSSFVHGSFFAQIAKDSKRNHDKMPIPNFDMLYRKKEYVRLALLAYLHLAELVKDNPKLFKNRKTIMNILEEAIIDMDLRKLLIKETKELFSLIPEPNFKFH